MSVEEMMDCVLLEKDQAASPESALTRDIEGVSEKPILGPANPKEGINAGKMAWEHGFHLRRLDMAAGTALPLHARAEEEVVYLFRGELAFQWESGELHMSMGDVLTVPKGLLHSFSNAGAEPLIAYIVRGGNAPAAPRWAPIAAEAAAGS
jgi:mannose-6-phosphate isomerase-like protein (cupin superfamily)